MDGAQDVIAIDESPPNENVQNVAERFTFDRLYTRGGLRFPAQLRSNDASLSTSLEKGTDVEPSPIFIDLVDDTGFSDDAVRKSKGRQKRRIQPVLRMRNGPIAYPFAEIKSCTYSRHHGPEIILHSNANVTVELEDKTFMRIVSIIQNSETLEKILRGWRFTRTKDLGVLHNGTLEKKTNEVCWSQRLDADDHRKPELQCMEEVPLTSVLRRRKLVLTNMSFPAYSWRPQYKDTIYDEKVITSVYQEELLVCRFKLVCVYANAASRERNSSYVEEAIVRLQEHEADRRCSRPHEELRDLFRGPTVKGGSYFGMLPIEADHQHKEREIDEGASKQMLTLGERCLKRRKLSRTSETREKTVLAGSSAASPIDLDTLLPPASSTESCKLDAIAELRTWRQNVTEIIDLTETVNDILHVNAPPKRHKPMSLNGHRSDSVSGSSARERSISPSDSCDTVKDSSPVFIDLSDDQEDLTPKVYRFNQEPSEDSMWSESTRLLSEADKLPRLLRSMQRYTLGDGFCGAGGISRGATMAGLRLEWAFDYEHAMCESYRLNFPATPIARAEAFAFVTQMRYGCQVDILHLSPPCQFFSPAHTVEGTRDMDNIAASFGIGEALRRFRPRILTIENTFGLQQQRHRVYLNAVVQQCTALGYSVRYKILNLADYGIPQVRQRLIIIASCPGEALPEFPPPTHSKYAERTGLEPWTSVNDFIYKIPVDWPDHNPDRRRLLDREPHDGTGQIGTITTGGSSQYHPSGERTYTNRELAQLQGFPLHHNFGKQKVARQIGNAVPPLFAKVLFTHIKRELMKVDGVLDAGRNGRGAPIVR